MTTTQTLTLADRKRLRERLVNRLRLTLQVREIEALLDALDEADRLLVWARKPAYFCQDCHSHRECEDDACPCSDCFQAQSAAYLARRKE